MEKNHLIRGFLFLLIFIQIIVPTRAYSTKLYPSDDAYVDSYYPDDNFGASDYLHIGTFLVGYCVTFLKFQIPSIDRTVLSATVSTYWYNFMCDTWLTVKAGTTDTTWNERTITYNNCPYHYYYLLATTSITDMDHFNFEVTNYIPESGPFAIIIFEESPYTGESLQGDSKECTLSPDPPYLTITYESRIEDFLPAIIGGIVGIIAVAVTITAVLLHLRNKKKKQRIGLEEGKVEKLDEKGNLFCPKCNHKLEKGAQFCTNCGNKL